MTLSAQEKNERQHKLTKKRKLDEIVSKMRAYGLSLEEVSKHLEVYQSSQEQVAEKRKVLLTSRKRRLALEKAREARKQKLEEKRNG